jgi:hypothetical protein
MATEQELAQALNPAFGIYPKAFRGNTGNPQDAANLPVDVMRGRTAGLLGMFGDVVNQPSAFTPVRAVQLAMQGVMGQDKYPDTEQFLKTLPLKPTSRAGEVAGQAASFVPLNPAPAVRAAKAGVQALGPTAANMAEGYMQRQGLMPGVLPIENKNMLSYRGSHEAPGPDFGAPLHDLTGGGQMYPADVYSPKAAQFYGGGVPYDQKAFSIAQQFKDKPDAFVTIYRAVPKELSNSEKLADIEKQMAAYMKRGTLPPNATTSDGSKWYDMAYAEREKLRQLPNAPTNDINNINPGDWVTLTREYAKDHGESALRGQYKILSQKVKAKDLWTNADSIHEFGYQPQTASNVKSK